MFRHDPRFPGARPGGVPSPIEQIGTVLRKYCKMDRSVQSCRQHRPPLKTQACRPGPRSGAGIRGDTGGTGGVRKCHVSRPASRFALSRHSDRNALPSLPRACRRVRGAEESRCRPPPLVSQAQPGSLRSLCSVGMTEWDFAHVMKSCFVSRNSL